MSCARRSPESRTPALRALRAGSLCPFRVVSRALHVLHVSLFSSSRRAPGAHGLRPGGAPPWRRSRRAPPSDPSPRLTGVAADDKLGTIPVLVVSGSAPLPGPWEDSPGMRETGSASVVSGSNAMHADERSPSHLPGGERTCCSTPARPCAQRSPERTAGCLGGESPRPPTADRDRWVLRPFPSPVPLFFSSFPRWWSRPAARRPVPQ